MHAASTPLCPVCLLDTALDGPDPDGDEPLRGALILTDRSVVVLRKLDDPI